MPKSLSILLLLTLFACDSIPKDPNRTLENARNGKLYVGITHHPPWTVVSDTSYSGIEADIVRGIARDLNARIEWMNASETVLMRKLDRYELNIVIGGFEKSSVWNPSAGFTNPYYKKQTLVATDGENAFIMFLEKYLHTHQKEIHKQIKSEN